MKLKSGDLVVLKVSVVDRHQAPVLGVVLGVAVQSSKGWENFRSLIIPFREHVIEPGRPYIVTSVDARTVESHVPRGTRIERDHVVLLDTESGREFMARRTLFRRLD